MKHKNVNQLTKLENELHNRENKCIFEYLKGFKEGILVSGYKEIAGFFNS